MVLLMNHYDCEVYMQREQDQLQELPDRLHLVHLVLQPEQSALDGGVESGMLSAAPVAKLPPWWKTILNLPAARIIVGLAVGVGLLFLVARYVDIPTTIGIVRSRLTTPQGIICALLSGLAFLAAFSIRG